MEYFHTAIIRSDSQARHITNIQNLSTYYKNPYFSQMALFQKSVLNQYLKQLDKSKVEIAYQKFKAHFHNATIQQQIRDSKEEQYQEGFFRDLFVDVFGFTLNPQPDYNLITEKKNESDSKSRWCYFAEWKCHCSYRT